MFENISSPEAIAAMVSGGVTIFLFVIKGIFSSWWSKHFLVYKIKSEHNYEQKKKTKEAISKYKMFLLNSAEDLNHRLWNFSGNCCKGWHTLKDNDVLNNKYYLKSFCYRFLAFHAWCLKFERELIYIDVTLSDKKDLDFIKYIKVMKNIICDASILDGTGYDAENATDHFFKNDLISLIEKMYINSSVMTYSEFEMRDINDYRNVYEYISSIAIDKTDNKWNVLNCFHYVLMAFLSRFGYDYQRTGLFKLYKLWRVEPSNILVLNLNKLMVNSKLSKCKEMKKSMAILKGESLIANTCAFFKIIKLKV